MVRLKITRLALVSDRDSTCTRANEYENVPVFDQELCYLAAGAVSSVVNSIIALALPPQRHFVQPIDV